MKKRIFPVDFVIHWKRTLRLFGSHFFSCQFFDVGLKSAGKQKLLEVNIVHVFTSKAPEIFSSVPTPLRLQLSLLVNTTTTISSSSSNHYYYY